MHISRCLPLHRKHIVLLVFTILLATVNCKGQASSSNFVQYDVNSAISFSLTTSSQIENSQSISDAFCLFTKTAAKSAHYYVSASNTTTTSTPMPIGNMILTFYSTDCPSGTYSNLNTSAIPLTTSNQLLFQIIKKNSFYNFCYSVSIPATGYTYAPGTYTWTITFTMSQP